MVNKPELKLFIKIGFFATLIFGHFLKKKKGVKMYSLGVPPPALTGLKIVALVLSRNKILSFDPQMSFKHFL